MNKCEIDVVRFPALSFSFTSLSHLPTCLFRKPKLNVGLHNRGGYFTFSPAPPSYLRLRLIQMFLIFQNNKDDLGNQLN